MLIWIIDNDISFARDLKLSLKALPAIQNSHPESKIELVLDLPTLEKLEQKTKKETALRPHLIFLDVELGDMSLLQVFERWKIEREDLADAVCFVSNTNFGSFENFFIEKGEPAALFVEKTRLQERLEKIVKAFDPDADREEKEARFPLPSGIPHFQLRKRLVFLRACSKDLEKLFYEEGLKQPVLPFFAERVQDCLAIAEDFSWNPLAASCVQVLKLLQQGAGSLKLKRDARVLLGMLEKIVEETKGAG